MNKICDISPASFSPRPKIQSTLIHFTPKKKFTKIKNPINLVLGKKFFLKPKDIVFIPPTRLVKWNRVITLLLRQTDLFKSYNPLIQEGVKSNSANQS